jgi:hypothetical protein
MIENRKKKFFFNKTSKHLNCFHGVLKCFVHFMIVVFNLFVCFASKETSHLGIDENRGEGEGSGG